MGRRSRHDSSQAYALATSLALKPLEDFPGWTKQWRMLHTTCGREVTPMMINIRRGLSRGCKYCAGRCKTEPDAASAELLGYAYEPLEPYPGYVGASWRCRHVECGNEVRVRLQKLRSGEGCCLPCGITRSAAKRAVDSSSARAFMLARLLEPLAPYPGANHQPWRCRCTLCHAIVFPTRANVWRGQGGCLACGFTKAGVTKREGLAGQARADMQAAGLEPIEPYPGTGLPWRCIHVPCGQEVATRHSHVKIRGLAHCQAKIRGFDRTAAAELYVVSHPKLGALKIGITGIGTARIRQWCDTGWELLVRLPFDRGAQAYEVEQRVLFIVREVKGLPPFLTDMDMGGYGGYTETIGAVEMAPSELLALVTEAEAAVGAEWASEAKRRSSAPHPSIPTTSMLTLGDVVPVALAEHLTLFDL